MQPEALHRADELVDRHLARAVLVEHAKRLLEHALRVGLRRLGVDRLANLALEQIDLRCNQAEIGRQSSPGGHQAAITCAAGTNWMAGTFFPSGPTVFRWRHVVSIIT